MTRVVAAAPLGAPVYRMQAELWCRDLDSAAHRAVERLLEEQVAAPQIAALLGLRRDQLAVIESQLDGTGGMRARTLRVWVDPAHETVLSHERGLDLIAAYRRSGIPLLDIPPPTAAELPTQRFTQAASTRGQQRERIVVDEVLALRPDMRVTGRRRNGDGRDHLLLLPEVALVVRAGAGGPQIEVHRGELLDEPLTAVARKQLLGEGRLRPELLTEEAATAAGALLHRALGTEPSEAFELSLEPAEVQERIFAEVARADEQLVVVCNGERRDWPRWMRDAVRGAEQRDVECVVRCTGRDGGDAAAPPGAGIVVVRDRTRVVAHSDPALLGAGWALGALAGQACIGVHEPAAVARVLERLDVPPPPPAAAGRRSPPEPLEDIAARALRAALEKLSVELPPGTPVVLEEDDERSFCEQAERNPINLRDEEAIEKLGRGMVWERVLAAACHGIAARNEQIVVQAMRLQALGDNIDLDVVVRNVEHGVWWILDAKCKRWPDDKDVRLMEKQLATAAREDWIPEGFEARGAIVYPAFSKEVPVATPDDRIVRWRLAALEQRLTEEPPPLDG
jgi:hypothetical protein